MAMFFGSNQISPISKNNLINNLPNKTIIPNQNQQIITPTSETINVTIPGTSGRTFSSSPIEVDIDASFLIYGETYQVVADEISYHANYRSSTYSSISINTQWVAGEDEEISFSIINIGTNDGRPTKVTLSKNKIRIYLTSVFGGDMGGNGSNGTISFTYLGTYDGIEQVTIEPIPSDYIIPEGTLSVLNSGTYDIASYADINIPGRSTYSFNIFFDIAWAKLNRTLNVPIGFNSSSIQISSSLQLSNTNGAILIPSTTSQTYYYSNKWTIGSIIVDAIPNSVKIYEKIIKKTINIDEINEFLSSQITVPSYGFVSCPSLSGALNLGAVTTIGSSAFYQCNKITTINGPNVTRIDSNAFQYCNKLSTVDMPALTSVGYSIFYNCPLTSFNFPILERGSIQWLSVSSTVSTIYLPNLKYDPCLSYLYYVKTFDLPELLSLNTYAFYQDSNATTFNLPKVNIINGNNIFTQCSGLSYLELPALSLISGNAIFGTCLNLHTLSFPKLEIWSASNVARNCPNLISIYLMNSSMVQLKRSDIFTDQSVPFVNSTLTGSFGSFYVPSSLLTTYQTDSMWSWWADKIVGI